MNRKHFETATIGAKSAKKLLSNGEIVATRIRVVHYDTIFGPSGPVEVLFAVYSDGKEVAVPSYAGDSPERIKKISSLVWEEETDWPSRIPQSQVMRLRDSTGAVLDSRVFW